MVGMLAAVVALWLPRRALAAAEPLEWAIAEIPGSARRWRLTMSHIDGDRAASLYQRHALATPFRLWVSSPPVKTMVESREISDWRGGAEVELVVVDEADWSGQSARRTLSQERLPLRRA